MRISIISIGSELLIGHTLNTNLAFIGEQLAEAGYTVDREVCIPDDPAVMEDIMRQELSEAELVISIGGLGPTRDDLTRPIGARVVGAELQEEPEVLRHIESYLGPRLELVPRDALRSQAQVPVGAIALLNHNGTAPGLWCPCRERVLLLLPGPPRELQPMFKEEAMPRIRQLGEPDSCRRSLRVYGIPEATVAERLESALSFPAQVEVAYCTRAGEVDIRLTAPPAMAEQLDELQEQAHNLFGRDALPGSSDLVQTIGDLLNAKGWRLALAESCTGGLIGAAITEQSGGSSFFNGGIICYSNESKINLLGVPAATIEETGAASEATARALAIGAQKTLAAEAAAAVTGIAGPTGGTVDKPTGLVYIATAVGKEVKVQAYNFSGNRERVRNRTVIAALNDLRIHLENQE